MPTESYVISLVTILTILLGAEANSRRFTIDYDQGTFLKDGQPFNYVSGSIHYSRVHPDLWFDRLYKMRFAGLDAIQVYVPWNFHETEHGVFNFIGAKDLERFLMMAHSLDLLVILRPGPYICAEWEFGGFPYWLIRDNATIALRTSDPVYLKYVTDWYSVLIPKMQRLLYVNGGPIISVQVENEYGSFGACDHDYLNYMLALIKRLLQNDDVVYFTTDGDGTGYLKCGAINGTLTTVDFGAGNAKRGYHVLNVWNSSFYGPYVNSEYYIGWLDLWGAKHAHVTAAASAKTLDDSLKMKANVNMYMFYGGTNFGFTSGAPGDNPFHPVPTSYDYDAAISEAGDLTYKYFLLRATIGKYKQLPLMKAPKNSTKAAYGKVNVTLQGPVHHCAPIIAKLGGYPVYQNTYPLRAELMDTGYGYILYRHILQQDASSATLSVPGIRDRGYVIINDVFQGFLYRDGPTEITINGKTGDTLSILAENMGRVGYGSGILRGTKGIISNVTIGGAANVTQWSMYNYRFNMSMIQQCGKLRRIQQTKENDWLKFVPSTFTGVFTVEEPADSFLRLDGWFKGHVTVNDFNLGRYWPVRGPQKTLYIPSSILKTGENHISVTELEFSPCSSNINCFVEFVSVPEINGNVTAMSEQMLSNFKTHHGW